MNEAAGSSGGEDDVKGANYYHVTRILPRE
jgi:hypothetical protein